MLLVTAFFPSRSVSSSSGGGLTDDSGIHTFNSSSIDGNGNRDAKKSFRKLPIPPKKAAQATVVKIRQKSFKKFFAAKFYKKIRP